MSEAFTTSGESSDITAGPAPQLQGLFIPGIDNSQFIDGFGMVTPWGGGSTARRYGDYGISAEVSQQSTQLNDLATGFIPGGGATYNLEGFVGPQGIPGRDGIDGITHLVIAPNSNFLVELPHNIDLINDLGTAIDKLIYTDAYNTYTESVWVERQPAGDVTKNWVGVASDSDGSNFIAGIYYGRLYTSADSGVNWTERQPNGNADRFWMCVASDDDGSHLIAGEQRLHTSANSGVTWTERQPAGDTSWNWDRVASDSDGSNLMAMRSGSLGRLYTSADSGVNWTERQPAGAVNRQWYALASDGEGSHLIAGCDNAGIGGRLYTSADSGVNWTERQPAGATNKIWYAAASDSDGSHLIAGVYGGRLYTSADSGVNWTERQPAGDGDGTWWCAASDSDGSHLIAGESSGRLYFSDDYGVSWTEEQPAGDSNKQWRTVSSNSDGTKAIVAAYNSRLYTRAETELYSEAIWAESTLTSAGRAILDDATAPAQATTLGLGTGDSPTWVGATITNACVLGSNSAVFQPVTDSTTFFQVNQADDSSFITGDTINKILTVDGYIDSSQTLDQSTYPSIQGLQDATLLQDGSTYTGTDSTMTTKYIGVKFTASGNHNMGDFVIRIKESANITNLTADLTGYIYADDGGSPSKPTGAALATGSDFKFNVITSAYKVLSVGTKDDLTSDTDYWLVLKWSTTPVGGNIILDSDVSANMGATSTDGITWTNTNVRLYYIIYAYTWYGVRGYSRNWVGTRGESVNEAGVSGISVNSVGVWGSSQHSYGVYGFSVNFIGLNGTSTNNSGVRCSSTNGWGCYTTSINSQGLYSYSINAYAALLDVNPASEDTEVTLVKFRRRTSGTAANGIGGRLEFSIENDAHADETTNRISTVLTNAVSGSETSKMGLWTRTGGAPIAENFTLLGNGFAGLSELLPETLLELTHATPYITLHNSTHEDTDGGRESRLNFKGEQGIDPFEETTLVRIEISHDGAGADDKGKLVISVNDGNDGDTPTQALEIGSDLLATFAGDISCGAISSGTSTFSTEGPTDNVGVSGVNTLFLDCSANDVTIGGFTGGVNGQVLYVARLCAGAFSGILEHIEGGGSQDIYLHAGADETLDTEYGGWILVCNGTSWFDTSHSKHI